MNYPETVAWAETMNCAVTVCDAKCVILYQNKAAREIYVKHGDLRGRNLMDCHPEHAQAIIRRLLTEGGTNAYTIEKKGVHKVIYQSAWSNEDGSIGGLVELSMKVPAEMPHYIRK